MRDADLRTRLADALERVEGWLFLDEAWALHESVRKFPGVDHSLTVVEIGSWKGRSTIALGLGLKTRGGGKLFAIDPHTGAGTPVGPTATVKDFQRNIAAAGVESLVELLMTTSQAARPSFVAKSVDVLFVDGSHEYAEVKSDILGWQDALRDESVVAFNDPVSPGVFRALQELVIRPRSPYRNPALVSNTVFFHFRRSEPWRFADQIANLRLGAVLQLKFRATPLWPYIPAWLVKTARRLSTRVVGSPPVA